MRETTIAVMAENGSATCDVDILNALLRGEVAAVEAYDQVIAKFAGQSQAVELRWMRNEHEESAAVLRERVQHFGGDPSDGSGVWGKLTAAITRAAKIFGPSSAMGALKQGEEFGIGQYENALTDSEVDTDDKELIRLHLLPRSRAHSAALDGMIGAMKK